MKNVVYFLGAGFSAPAGLPVISNFLFKARNQYCSKPELFSVFKLVFDYIDSLSKAKNFISVDLFNIEEVFSISDIHGLLGHDRKNLLETFIKDVIKYHTPNFRYNEGYKFKQNFEKIFGINEAANYYVSFIAALLFIIFKQKKDVAMPLNEHSIFAETSSEREVDYRIITLNYDTVIEDAIAFLENKFGATCDLPIAKLHGSVDTNIVPPTWNKALMGDIETSWRKAAEWLSKANEIRILGYSIPNTDIYIKHLLSTALVESGNLQLIDVICLDPDGSVQRRYDNLFCFPKYKFFNANIQSYLTCFSGRGISSPPFRTDLLYPEERHEQAISQLMGSYTRTTVRI
jgi:hypothetical protein